VTFVAGNKRTLYFGTQSLKGTAQDTPTLAMRVEEFTPNEVRTKIQLAETDRATQEAADAVTGFGGGFSFKAYLRPSEAAFFLQALLGANTDSGSPTDYTHTLTASETTPYLTMFEVEPSVLCNKYVDIRITKIEFSGDAGGAIEATIYGEALSFAAGASAPSSPAVVAELPYVYAEVTVTKGGAHPGTCDQWSVTIDRNGKRIQGDVGFASLDYVNGKFVCNGQITKYLADDDDQRQVDTGATSGTAPTVTIFSEQLKIKLTRTSVLSVEFTFTEVSWPTRSAAVNTDGSPLAEVMGFRTLPQATLAANVSVVVKDHRATPDG
jgi:hypothetical protein